MNSLYHERVFLEPPLRVRDRVEVGCEAAKALATLFDRRSGRSGGLFMADTSGNGGTLSTIDDGTSDRGDIGVAATGGGLGGIGERGERGSSNDISSAEGFAGAISKSTAIAPSSD